MRGIKIPQQYFALKMQGGLMREGGRICGTLRYTDLFHREVCCGAPNDLRRFHSWIGFPIPWI